jgi:hypothetical protein
MPRTNARSTSSTSIGRRIRLASVEKPVAKSSSAMRTPMRRSAPRVCAAAPKSSTNALSMTSGSRRCGRSPLVASAQA